MDRLSENFQQDIRQRKRDGAERDPHDPADIARYREPLFQSSVQDVRDAG